ncbi:MAG: potassium channel protein [Gemmatimonadetes bacterium]|nr:potassium channel protein [Gemmatimonadota bacterium]
MRRYKVRFIGTALYFFSVILVGTIGYVAIEGWSWGDGIYMTVITLTAVGYDEVNPLSPNGRLFTTLILFGGITGLGLWFAFLTSFIVELDLAKAFRRRRIQKEVKKMKDHVIVCGAGRTGSQVIEELLMAGVSFVVIERDRETNERLEELLPDVNVIEGDATADHFLEEAGIGEARGLIACLSHDTDNLFVCLSARDQKADLEIVARAYEEETVPKLYRAGANHVVSPNASGAIRMASYMLRPVVVSFLDVATRSPDLTLRMEQERVSESSPLVGKTLADVKLPQYTGLIVIGIQKKNPPEAEEEFTYVFNPQAETCLGTGDIMIVLGKPEQIDKLRKFVNP